MFVMYDWTKGSINLYFVVTKSDNSTVIFLSSFSFFDFFWFLLNSSFGENASIPAQLKMLPNCILKKDFHEALVG